MASSVGADFRVIHIYRFGTPAAINFVARATSDEALALTERAMLDAVERLRGGDVDPALLDRALRSLQLEWEQIRENRLELAFTLGHFQSMDAWKNAHRAHGTPRGRVLGRRRAGGAPLFRCIESGRRHDETRPTESDFTMTTKTFAVALGLSCVATFLLLGCEQEPTILPGHSRPLLEHDWPHPRDYVFEPSSFQPPDPEPARLEAASGLRAYVITDTSDPLVRVTAAVPIGRLYEREGEAGASEALTRALTDGGRGSPPLSLRLETLGTRLDAELGIDELTLAVEVLAEDWEEGVRLMVDVLRDARPAPAMLRDFRTGTGFASPTGGVTGQGFRPSVELERRLGGYPLSPPEPGQPVGSEAVRAIASRSLAPELVVLGIGGNVPREEAADLLNEVTRGWERSAERPELRALDAAEGSGTLWTIDDDTLEGWVAIGRAIGPVPVDERAPLAVLGEILGTRLNIEAREIRGLANRATFFLPETGNGAGLLHIRTGGRLEAVAPLVKYCRDELAGLQSGEKAVTDEELALAKGILRLGKRQEALESARPSAAAYALATLHHGDTALLLSWPGEVEAVTADEVLAAARKYLDPQTMDTIVIGPIGRIHEARHPRWSVELSSLSPRGS